MCIEQSIRDLLSVPKPKPDQYDPSRMTEAQIEETILSLIEALGYMDKLLDILARATFSGEKEKSRAEQLSALTSERILWVMELIMRLRPVTN